MSSGDQAAEAFELMQRLIEYRYDKPLHHQIMKAADYSMLSEDVLVLIYHMAKVCGGGILGTKDPERDGVAHRAL